MFLKNLFGGSKTTKNFSSVVSAVNKLEKELEALTAEGLLAEGAKLKESIKTPEDLDTALPRAFALVREASKRTLKQRHFDVQLMGGYVLHQAGIAEMRTGEGKTLVGTLPTYLNALAGRGVHVVTVNEYLAKRDAVWMGQVYHALGMKVACLVHGGALMYDPEFRVAKEKEDPLKEGGLVDAERDTTGAFLVQTEYLRPTTRQEAYQADITYGTNHEFGFDYLRDNLASSLAQKVQRGHHYAVIDEVDSILIDEARTPLIIAGKDEESSQAYKMFARVATRLEKDTDYILDEKFKAVSITQAGIDKIESATNIKNIYSPENSRLVHYLTESLRAHSLFVKDRDYIVKNNEIVIVDQFTGRLMQGRRYSGGLHQAIEAKEGVPVQNESKTYAQISIQNYFRLYKKLSGMTGTAQTSAEEFHKVYNLEVVTIPTNREMVRKDEQDLIYKTVDAKYDAIIKDVKERNAKGQPVLIGTVSIEKNEELSRRLSRAGLKHEALNAKNNEREGAIVAQAGALGAITVATNMAGRGVDIILGGNPPKIEDQQKVREAGGLHVIGTERHESRRIDNQLRGRAGRQGDPGSSQFFLSMEDDLMRIFGGERIGRMMAGMKLPEDMPIQAGILNKAVGQAQSKVEGNNFDARKHLLEYDDVLNKQRLSIYRKRDELLAQSAHPQILGMLDLLWMTHLEDMEALAESVRLRAVAQHDPLVEYRREGHELFKALLANFDQWYAENKEKYQNMPVNQEPPRPQMAQLPEGTDKVGRNDPCPCGSGKKYKKCHGA